MADWILHLSTIFPEIRLRPQLEIRSIDALPADMSLAAAALLKGLFYDPAAQAEVMKLFRTDEIQASYEQAPRLGLKTRHNNRTLQEIAIDAIAIAREGLKRQKAKNNCGMDETIYLDAVEEIATTGVTLAERLLRDWHGTPEEKLAALLRHSSLS
jgi:glutamate--cysteine ligase